MSACVAGFWRHWYKGSTVDLHENPDRAGIVGRAVQDCTILVRAGPEPFQIIFVFDKEHTEGVAMNKSDLIDAMADLAGLSKAEAGRALEAFIESAKKALKKNDTISLVGFGTFSVRERAARTGRNPRTGETIKIKASKNPTFKAGKALKDAVN